MQKILNATAACQIQFSKSSQFIFIRRRPIPSFRLSYAYFESNMSNGFEQPKISKNDVTCFKSKLLTIIYPTLDFIAKITLWIDVTCIVIVPFGLVPLTPAQLIIRGVAKIFQGGFPTATKLASAGSGLSW